MGMDTEVLDGLMGCQGKGREKQSSIHDMFFLGSIRVTVRSSVAMLHTVIIS